MRQVIAVVELGGRKTISVTDIVFILNRVRQYQLHSHANADLLLARSYAVWLRSSLQLIPPLSNTNGRCASYLFLFSFDDGVFKAF
jgi:hypothetical protein